MPLFYPFVVVSGKSRGEKRSTQDLLTPFQKAQSLGQAKLDINLNVTQGNLGVNNYSPTVQDNGFAFSLGSHYNSQDPQQPWRLSCLRSFNPPAEPNIFLSEIIINEGDGSETHYRYDNALGCYVARGLREGQCQLKYSAELGWQHVELLTGTQESFNQKGQLTSKKLANGKTLQFHYENNRLTQLDCPSGERYTFTWQNKQLQITQVTAEKSSLLISHTFADETYSFIIDTSIPLDNTTPYKIHFDYDPLTHQLIDIKQSDGTSQHFHYDEQQRVDIIQAGEDKSSCYHIIYENNQTKITNPNLHSSIYVLDEVGRIHRLSSEFSNTITDLCDYVYQNDTPLITEIHYANGEVSHVAYDNFDAVTTRDDHNINQQHYYRDPNSGLLLTQTIYGTTADAQSNQPFTKRFVYNDKRQCVFEIDPQGIVKEHRFDENENLASTRIYLDNTYNLTGLSLTTAIGLEEITQWVATQAPDHIHLQQFGYDQRGQLKLLQGCIHVDEHGNGMVDDNCQEQQFEYDAFSHCLTHRTKVNTEGNFSIITKKFDGLGRLVSHTDPLQCTTLTEYQDTKQCLKITYPNKKQITRYWNTRGLITKQQIQVESILRTTQYSYDNTGNRILITHPDNNQTHKVVDERSRLIASLNALNILTEYRYDERNRQIAIIKYSKRVNDLILLTQPSQWQIQLSNPETDRAQFFRYDAANRQTHYYRPDRSLVMYQLDNQGRKLNKTEFATRLSDEQWLNVYQQQTIIPNNDPAHDHFHQFFYDKNNNIIAQIKAAKFINNTVQGFLIETEYDKLNHATQVTRYIDLCALNNNLTNIKSLVTNKISVTRFRYDNLGRRIATLDPEGYLTTRSYKPNNYIASTRAYYLPVADIQHAPFQAPNPHPSDHKITRKYDLNNHIISILDSHTQCCTEFEYDSMGLIVRKLKTDQALSSKVLQSVQTQPGYVGESAAVIEEQFIYDGFSQLIAYYNPSVCAKIKLDANLKGEQHQYDDIGLRIQTTDADGYSTYFYYDALHRLVYSINAKGGICAITYSPFDNEVTSNTILDQLLPNNLLNNLSGGLAKTEFIKQITELSDPARDRITRYQQDTRGNICKIINPIGAITQRQYNPFNQEIQRIDPLSSGQSITIIQEYDLRNLMIQQTRTSQDGNLSLAQQWDYNFLGQTEKHINEMGVFTKFIYSLRGDLQQIIAPLNRTTHHVSDAFHRCVQIKSPAGRITTIEFNAVDRSKTTFYPDNTKEIEWHDAFNNLLVHQDRDGMQTGFQWDGNSRCVLTHLSDGSISTQQFSLAGREQQELAEHDPNNPSDALITLNQYNLAGEHNITILDPDHATYKTQVSLNSHGDTITSKDPRGFQTITVRDQMGRARVIFTDPEPEKDLNELSTKLFHQHLSHSNSSTASNEDFILVDDPEEDACSEENFVLIDSEENESNDAETHLNIHHLTTYNFQDQVVDEIIGDPNMPIQYYLHHDYDGLGRLQQSIIDPISVNRPDALNLITRYEHDRLGRCVVEYNALKQPTFHIFDAVGNECYTVFADGATQGFIFDADDLLTSHTIFANRIDISKINSATTVDDLSKLVVTDSNDSISIYFYDGTIYPCYEVQYIDENNARVSEFHRLASGHIYYQRQYQTPLPVSSALLETNSIDVVRKFCLAHQIDSDRQRWDLVDNRGRPRFSITAEGEVSEKRYDKRGNCIFDCHYSQPVAISSLTPSLTIDSITNTLKTSDLDRQQYHCFDILNREVYCLRSDFEQGKVIYYVTEFRYDENDNLVDEIQYATPLHQVPEPLNLSTIASTITHDENADRHHTKIYDARDLVEMSADPLGGREKFTYNALKKQTRRIDKRGNAWETQYDIAQRQLQTLTPEHDYLETTLDPTTGQINAVHQTGPQIQRYEYDDASQISEIVTGYNSHQSRTIGFAYTPRGSRCGSTVENVPLDDPTKAITSLNDYPATNAVTSTLQVFNTRNQVIMESDLNSVRFTQYDRLGRKRFCLDKNQYLTEWIYSTTFEDAEATCVKRYLTRVNDDLGAYRNTALTLSQMQAFATKLAPGGVRQFFREVDRCGRKVRYTSDPVLAFIPSSTIGDTAARGKLVKINRETLWTYNAFGEEILKKELVDPVNNVYRIKRTWRNHAGEAVGVLQDDQLSLTFTNAFGKIIGHYLYHSPTPAIIPIAPSSTQTAPAYGCALEAVIAATPVDIKKDHSRSFIRDRNGKIERMMQASITYQTLTQLANGHYDVADQTQDLTTDIKLSPTGKKIKVTDINGYSRFYYYDKLDRLYAYTLIPRENAITASTTYTPLVILDYNIHGDIVAKHHYSHCLNPSEQSFQIDPNAECRTVLMAMDLRGLEIARQDPMNAVSLTTYTANRKKARQWIWREQASVLSQTGEITQQLLLHSKQYDLEDRITKETRAQPENNEQHTLTQTWDADFLVAQQHDDNPPIQYTRDSLGFAWQHNSNNGVAQIELTNGVGDVTLVLQSASQDLMKITLDNLPALFNTSYRYVMQTILYRDLQGRVITQQRPTFDYVEPRTPELLSARYWSGNASSQSAEQVFCWDKPNEPYLEPILTLRQYGQESIIQRYNKSQLENTNIPNVYGIKVGTLPSDLYQGTIEYYFRDPISKELEVHPTYRDVVIIPVKTNVAGTSYNVVIEQTSPKTLSISGNHADVSAIAFKIDGVLTHTKTVSNGVVDISDMPSGRYQISPIRSSSTMLNETSVIDTSLEADYKLNASEPTDFEQIMDIYTPNRAIKTVVREVMMTNLRIDLSGTVVNLSLEWLTAKLSWTLPPQLQGCRTNIVFTTHVTLQVTADGYESDVQSYNFSKEIDTTEYSLAIPHYATDIGLSYQHHDNYSWSTVINQISPVPMAYLGPQGSYGDRVVMNTHSSLRVTLYLPGSSGSFPVEIYSGNIPNLVTVNHIEPSCILSSSQNKLLVYPIPKDTATASMHYLSDADWQLLKHYPRSTQEWPYFENIHVDANYGMLTIPSPGLAHRGRYHYILNFCDSHKKTISASSLGPTNKDGNIVSCFDYTDGMLSIWFPTSVYNPYQAATPVARQEYDRFSRTSLTLPNGDRYDFTTNKMGKQTSVTEPERRVVSLTNSQGSKVRPKRITGYNPSGHLIVKQSASGANQVYLLNAVGDVLSAIDRDLVAIRYRVSAYGEILYRDINGAMAITMARDPRGNLVTTTDMCNNITHHQCNALGLEIRLNDYFLRTFSFDAMGRQNGEFIAGKMQSITAYHYPSGQPISIQYPNGTALTWKRAFSGEAMTHTDLSGVITTSELNRMQQVISRKSTKPSAPNQVYPSIHGTSLAIESNDPTPTPMLAEQFIYNANGSPLFHFNDVEQQRVWTMQDLNGREYRQQITGQHGQLLVDRWTTFSGKVLDTLRDTVYAGEHGYDIDGYLMWSNNIVVLCQCITIDGVSVWGSDDPRVSQVNYYKRTPAGRILIAKGVYQDNQIIRTAKQGYEIQYDPKTGLRVTVLYPSTDNNLQGNYDTLSYYPNGILQKIANNHGESWEWTFFHGQYIHQITHNNVGTRPSILNDWFHHNPLPAEADVKRAAASQPRSEVTTLSYNDTAALDHQEVVTVSADGRTVTTSQTQFQLDNANVVTGQTRDETLTYDGNAVPEDTLHDTITHQQAGFDEPTIVVASGTRTRNNQANTAFGTVVEYVDSYGMPIVKMGGYPGSHVPPVTMRFLNTPTGQRVLAMQHVDTHWYFEHFFYYQQQLIGRAGNLLSLSPDAQVAMTSLFRQTPMALIPLQSPVLETAPLPPVSFDEDIHLSAETGNLPTQSNITIAAEQGDSLEPIASRYLGDPTRASDVANGFPLSQTFAEAGTHLLISPAEQLTNAQQSTAVDDEQVELFGSFYPNMPIPVLQEHHPHHKWWAIVAMAVIDVVAAVVTDGLASALYADMLGSANAAAGTAIGSLTLPDLMTLAAEDAAMGAAVATAADIATQGVSFLDHTEHHFQWHELGKAALQGGEQATLMAFQSIPGQDDFFSRLTRNETYTTALNVLEKVTGVQ
ncbi:MAG: RHS repeat protein [Legionellales bacterium]|nr:RHS repeat protein [Legionellales bacterium]